jgi:hypothetical protein
MQPSVSHPAPAAHGLQDVVGVERLHGRSQEWLSDAMTFLAWYAPGTFTAVVDYLDWCDGELERGPGLAWF